MTFSLAVWTAEEHRMQKTLRKDCQFAPILLIGRQKNKVRISSNGRMIDSSVAKGIERQSGLQWKEWQRQSRTCIASTEWHTTDRRCDRIFFG
jgi:hypothetical protein